MEENNFLKKVLQRAKLDHLEADLITNGVDKRILLLFLNSRSGSPEERVFKEILEIIPGWVDRFLLREAIKFYASDENDSDEDSGGINIRDQRNVSWDFIDLTEINVKKGLIIGGAAVVTCGLLAVGAVVAAPFAIAAAGFGTGGVVAGSLAAGFQSWIGSVAAGSVFAGLQSAGAVGLAASTTAAIGAVGGGVGAVVGAGVGAGVCAARNSSAQDKKNHQQ